MNRSINHALEVALAVAGETARGGRSSSSKIGQRPFLGFPTKHHEHGPFSKPAPRPVLGRSGEMDRPIMLMMPAEGASITSIIGIIVHHFCLQDMLQGCFRVARIHGFSTRNGVPIALLTLGVRM